MARSRPTYDPAAACADGAGDACIAFHQPAWLWRTVILLWIQGMAALAAYVVTDAQLRGSAAARWTAMAVGLVLALYTRVLYRQVRRPRGTLEALWYPPLRLVADPRGIVFKPRGGRILPRAPDAGAGVRLGCGEIHDIRAETRRQRRCLVLRVAASERLEGIEAVVPPSPGAAGTRWRRSCWQTKEGIWARWCAAWSHCGPGRSISGSAPPALSAPAARRPALRPRADNDECQSSLSPPRNP